MENSKASRLLKIEDAVNGWSTAWLLGGTPAEIPSLFCKFVPWEALPMWVKAQFTEVYEGLFCMSSWGSNWLVATPHAEEFLIAMKANSTEHLAEYSKTASNRRAAIQLERETARVDPVIKDLLDLL